MKRCQEVGLTKSSFVLKRHDRAISDDLVGPADKSTELVDDPCEEDEGEEHGCERSDSRFLKEFFAMTAAGDGDGGCGSCVFIFFGVGDRKK